MSEKPFYLKSGELSRYGLACGYIERVPFDDLMTVFWREHNCYHVRTTGELDGGPVRQWDVFDTLTEARRGYHRHLRAQFGEVK